MKKILTILLTFITLFQMTIPTTAQSDHTELIADALNHLGIFMGTDKGYALDKTLTRAEAVTMIVRLLGKEEYALAQKYDAPFMDVPDWAKPYVNFAYKNNITKGVSSTEFHANTEITTAQFLTLVLRLLGYDDQAGQFQWNAPFDLAASIGLFNAYVEKEVCYRSQMVMICWNAIHCNMPLKNEFLVSKLISENTFTLEEFIYVYNNILHTTMKSSIADKLGLIQTVVIANSNVSTTDKITDINVNTSETSDFPKLDNTVNDFPGYIIHPTPPKDTTQQDDSVMNSNNSQQENNSVIGDGEIGEDW